MGTLTLYAIKSSLTLALLYLPYSLLLRRDTSFRLNRAVLLAIVLVALIVPSLDLHIWDNRAVAAFEPQQGALRQITLPTFVVGADSLRASDHEGEGRGKDLLVLLYIIGMLACLAWKTIGLARIVRLIPRGCLWTDKTEDGITIYCHPGQVAPFSWMRSIVVDEENAESDSPVLLHELTHVRLGHSWDALFVSLAEAFQWFNPCVWMLDASLREVHEYEADDAVLRRGISAREYQLLLIKKAVAGSRYPMVNGFNHSLLKNRITMMTKQKTSPWARLKALYAVPLTFVAIGAFASQQFTIKAEIPANPQSEETEVTDATPIHIKPGTLRLVVDGKEMTEKEVVEAVKALQGKKIDVAYMESKDLAVVEVKTSDPDDKVYDKPEVLPEFPGGTDKFWEWLRKEVKYPKEALEYGVEGRVYIEFVVEKNGEISNMKEIAGPDSERGIVVTAYKAKDDSPEEVKKENESKGRKALQEEALRVAKAMPNWTPGRDKGKAVRTKFVLPIVFRLS